MTGHWLGNDEFAQFNVNQSLSFSHMMYAIGRRIYVLFLSDGHFPGRRGADRRVAAPARQGMDHRGLVAVAQTAVVTLLGGAVLDRYMLPVLPILYAAFAVAALAWSRPVRLCVQAAMVTLFVMGWFWNSPVLFPYEDNLAMVDFVRLQQASG